MKRQLLRGRWLALHVIVIAADVAFAFLGRWQWHRAMSPDGPPQSLFYAIQWWSFILLVGYGWLRMVREELHAPSGGQQPRRVLAATLPSPTAPAEEPSDDEVDVELAAYNRYLADLNAQAQAQQR